MTMFPENDPKPEAKSEVDSTVSVDDAKVLQKAASREAQLDTGMLQTLSAILKLNFSSLHGIFGSFDTHFHVINHGKFNLVKYRTTV